MEKHKDLLKIPYDNLENIINNVITKDYNLRGNVYEACWRLVFASNYFPDYQLLKKDGSSYINEEILDLKIMRGNAEGSTDIRIKKDKDEYIYVSSKFHTDDKIQSKDNYGIKDIENDALKFKEQNNTINYSFILVVNNSQIVKEILKRSHLTNDDKSKFKIYGMTDLIRYWKCLNSYEFIKREIKMYGEVYTPPELINKMLDKFERIIFQIDKVNIWEIKDKTYIEPACGLAPFLFYVYLRLMNGLKNVFIDESERRRHILENMLYFNEIQEKNINIIKMIFRGDRYKLNINHGNFLEYDDKSKFDIILENPPYQLPDQGNNNGKSNGNTIWQHFVVKSLNLLHDNGFMLMIHPPGWRKPNTKRGKFNGLFDKLTKENQMYYLEIHDSNDGKKTFDCGTKYDWYLLQKKIPIYCIDVVDENGDHNWIDSRQWNWLPHSNFNNIKRLIDGHDKCSIVEPRSAYMSTKKSVSTIESKQFCYKLIHSTGKSGIRYLYSSCNNNGHFGIPKIIFGDSGIYNPIIDMDGIYGMSEHAIGIKISSENEGNEIINFLKSNYFQNILKSCIWSNFQIDRVLFTYFRKDFWKIVPNDSISEILISNEAIKNNSLFDETNDISRHQIDIIKTVKDLKEMFRKYKIPGVSKIRKSNINEYKNIIIEKLSL